LYASKQTRYNIYGILAYNSTGTNNSQLETTNYHLSSTLDLPCQDFTVTAYNNLLHSHCTRTNVAIYSKKLHDANIFWVSTSIWQRQNNQKCYHRSNNSYHWRLVCCFMLL